MAFIDHFLDCAPDTVVAQPGYYDVFGTWVASGTALNLSCRIEGGPVLVRNKTGQEVVSSVRCVVIGYNDLTEHAHRYTLPSRYTPYQDLTAIRIDKESDEDGTVYEEVVLP